MYLIYSILFIHYVLLFTFCDSVTFYVNRMCALDGEGNKRYRTESGYRVCSSGACQVTGDDACLICCKQCSFDVIPKTNDDGEWGRWTSWSTNCVDGYRYRRRSCSTSSNSNETMCEMQNKSKGHMEEETLVCHSPHSCSLTSNIYGIVLLVISSATFMTCIFLAAYINHLKTTIKGQRTNLHNQKTPYDPCPITAILVTTEKYNSQDV